MSLNVYMQCSLTSFPQNADVMKFQMVASLIIRIYYILN